MTRLSRICRMKRPPTERRGAAAVEMALVLVFLAMLLFGMMQTSWMLLVRHKMLNACREGARLYASEDGTNMLAKQRTREVLRDLFGDTNGELFTIEDSASGADRTITVSIPTSTAWISFGDIFGFFDDASIITTTAVFRDQLAT